MNKKKLMTVLLLSVLAFNVLLSPMIILVHAQEDLEAGVTEVWTHPHVRFIDTWFSVDMLRWEDDGGRNIPISSDDPSIKIGNNPRIDLSIGSVGKVGERFVGAYQISDGRHLVLNEYTFSIDIDAFTNEDFTTYFGASGNVEKIFTEELYRVDTWRLVRTGNDAQDTTNPVYWDNPRFHSSVSGNLNISGYDVDDTLYNIVGSLQTKGSLRLSIDLDSGAWLSVFRNVTSEDGVYAFDNDIYTRIVDVMPNSVSTGYLSGGMQDQDSDGVGVLMGYQEPEKTKDSITKNADFGADILPAFSTLLSLLVPTSWTWQAEGHYIPEGSGIQGTTKNVGIAQTVTEGSLRSIYYPNTELPIRYANTFGFDPDTGIVDEVEFEVPFDLRPETEVTEYRHRWTHEINMAESYLTTQSDFDLTYEAWRSSAPKMSEIAERVTMSEWYIKNMYASSTFYITVQIGAYYDWIPDPIEEEEVDLDGYYPDLDTTKSIFPQVEERSEEEEADTILDWFMDKGWIIIVAIAIGGIGIIFFIRSRRSKSTTAQLQPKPSPLPQKQGLK